MTVGESVLNGPFGDTGCPPGCIVNLQDMGALPGGPFISPSIRGTCMVTKAFKIQSELGSTAGASKTGSTESSENGELRCSEALKGATGRNPGSVNLKGLTEKVGSRVFPET
jgi:hypothetical protein